METKQHSFNHLLSTLFRHEARQIIRNATRASENDAVIFTGSGTIIRSLTFLKFPRGYWSHATAYISNGIEITANCFYWSV